MKCLCGRGELCGKKPQTRGRKCEAIVKARNKNLKIQKTELSRKAEGREQDIWWNSE